jgi:predicted DNA-binding protein
MANVRENKTELLRGKCEPSLKLRVNRYLDRTRLPESYLVREAVREFLNEQENQLPTNGNGQSQRGDVDIQSVPIKEVEG